MTLNEEEAEERRKALTVIWEERMGPNHTKVEVCTAEEFADTLGLLDVTN